MNKPSCVWIVPVVTVHAIPNNGTMPRTIEITSIIVTNRPPRSCSDGSDRAARGHFCPRSKFLHSRQTYSALKLASTVLLSFGPTVTFCSCVPSFSCTNAIV